MPGFDLAASGTAVTEVATLSPEQRAVMERFRSGWVAIGFRHGRTLLGGTPVPQRVIAPLFAANLIARGFAGRGLLTAAGLALLETEDE